MVIISGGIDLSVGSLIALVSVVVALVLRRTARRRGLEPLSAVSASALAAGRGLPSRPSRLASGRW